jgi:hypothetical protein
LYKRNVSSLVNVPCSIEATPARRAALTPSTPCACADLAAEAAGGVDHGLDLVVHHLLTETAGHVGQNAAAGRDLDDVDPERDLVADGAAAIVGAVAGVDVALGGDRRQIAVEAVARIAMTARHRDAGPGRDDGGPGEHPFLDRVAERGDQAGIVAEVANGGETGQQRAPGVHLRREGVILIVAERRLQPGLEAVVGVAAEVHVAVDQARHDRVVAQVHHAGAGQVDEAVAHLGDAAPAHHHARLPPRRPTGLGHQGAGMDHRYRLRGGGCRRGLRRRRGAQRQERCAEPNPHAQGSC